MIHYRHTQVGTVILVAIIFAVLLALVVMAQIGSHPIPWIVLGILVLLALLFAWLTVEVSGEAVAIRFGIGAIRKSWALTRIREARCVRNHWVYGWGIRLTPHGWLYNVSGLDAVELSLADDSRVRIGTDQSRVLLAAIAQASGGSIATPGLDRPPQADA
jgi:hypothetical protein